MEEGLGNPPKRLKEKKSSLVISERKKGGAISAIGTQKKEKAESSDSEGECGKRQCWAGERAKDRTVQISQKKKREGMSDQEVGVYEV